MADMHRLHASIHSKSMFFLTQLLVPFAKSMLSVWKSFLSLGFSLSLSLNLYLSNLFPHILLICSYSFKHFCFSLKKSPPNQDQKITESPRTSECVLCVLYTPLFRFFFFYCWYCCLVSLLLLMLLNSHFLFELYLKFEFWLLFDI